jgi:hypothetical protein
MRITQHKEHLLLVDKQIGGDCISPVVDHYLSRDFDVVHMTDMKLPMITKSRKKKVIIVTPEATLGNSSREGNSSMHEKKQCFSPSKLAKYENEIAKMSKEPIEAIVCCYTEKWIGSLSFADIIHLLNSHSGIIHKGGFSEPWNRRTFMAFITQGIEESLGSGSSYLLMKTLHHIYKIDEDVIWRDPQVFEEKTKRMFGKSADNILDAISRRLMEKISFNNNYARSYEHWAVA